eukprot:CAMPEP_0168601444 /NCGR_PEP_ID=MMETSP0420-20121227/13455_1 /TAXON_ID=498008 /ORGANISM="Pessonella sp." /LENGTH=54 /DNA_ID=CAMNT_0008639871 /DNA_START=1 /DNA_END=162 /DNA_ORIENTATION=+
MNVDSAFGKLSADEIEMNKAMLASVQTATTGSGAREIVPILEKKRDGLLPVGLK